MYKPLTNGVCGLYCKLCAFSTSIIYGQSANHKGHELKWKKQGVVTYNVHRENKVSKMFIISHGNSIGPESSPYFRIWTTDSTNHSTFSNYEI